MIALIRGLKGHPSHPPLTDATIGMFVLATGLAVLGKLGVAEGKLGPATWLALVGGLVLALVGFLALTAGGWYGGAVVFVHGMGVEKEVEP